MPRSIRKSAFMLYRKCQKRFHYFYNDPNYFDYNTEEEDQPVLLRRGTQFHKACDRFFDNLVGKELTADLHEEFRSYLPTGTDIDEWFDWFAEIERERYKELYGSGQVGAFMPIARELEILAKDTRDRTGHVDRIDIMPNTAELCVIEYKTGHSYDMEKQDAVTEMNAEIGFYVQILQMSNIFPKNRITHWKVINPLLKKVWLNKIHPVSLRGVDDKLREINKKLDTNGDFERNPSPLCDSCPYIDDCLFSNKEELVDI